MANDFIPISRSIAEIFSTDKYKNTQGTTKTLTIPDSAWVNMNLYLQSKGYHVLCGTSLDKDEISELKPMIIMPVTDENGLSYAFNCVPDWNTFISSGYTELPITYNGIINQWEKNTIVKDIWHAVGLTEKLEDYGEDFFNTLADEIVERITQNYSDSNINFLELFEEKIINWLQNDVVIPFIDLEDGTLKVRHYYPDDFYKAFYDYIYDNYTTSSEITYTLKPQPTTGDYVLTTPVKLTKDLFRYAFTRLANGDTINPSKYEWFLPDSDYIYDNFVVSEIGDIINTYDYCNIMFVCNHDYSSYTGYDYPDVVQIQLYNIPENKITVSQVGTGVDNATITANTTTCYTLNVSIGTNMIDATHVVKGITYNKMLNYTNNNTTWKRATSHKMMCNAYESGMDLIFTNAKIICPYSGSTWSNGYWGVSSPRYSVGEGQPEYFIKWKTPSPYTPRTTDEPNYTPVNPDPKPDDKPEPEDLPPDSRRPVRPIPPPLIKIIFTNLPIPPTPDPDPIIGVPPIRTVSTVNSNNMVKTWYTGPDEMDAVNSVLWQDSVIQTLSNIFKNNPLDCVLRFSELYVEPVEGVNYDAVENIVLGNVDCGDDSASNLITNPFIEMNLGQTQIPRYFNDFRDYNPYTTLRIYLPFVGWTNANINEFMGRDLKITATVNILTGDLVFHILRVDGETETEVNTLNGNCSNTLPMSARDRMSLGVGIAGAVGSLAYGNIIGAVGTLANSKESITKTGTITGNIGAMCTKVPYAIITRPCTWDDKDAYRMIGEMSNVYCSLGALSGYVKCKEIHIEGFTGPDEIKEYITNLCKNGVHIK